MPTPRKDHAVGMARFASDCLYRFGALVNSMEARLGPGTSSLKIRIGLHSGSVTGEIADNGIPKSH